MDNSQRKKFVLRIKPTVSSGNDQVQAAQAAPTVPNKKRKTKKPGTKAECEVREKYLKERAKQLDDAVDWCQKHNKTGYQAIKTGNYNLIKSYKTVNARLNGKVVSGEERSHSTILLPSEEASIVEFLKNKNRAYQGLKKKDLEKLILDVLRIRNHFNKTVPRGRRTVPLSGNAKRAIKTNKLRRPFWRRWDAKYIDITKKRQGTVSLKRGLNCTREMAEEHLDGLAEELIQNGIFTDAKQKGPGLWDGEIDVSRIFNHDETPQFVNYGVDGGPSGLTYGARGEEVKKLIIENRECVTINPVISLDGKVCMCQVIFAGKGVSSNMAPKEAVDKIPYLLVSTTENGIQDNASLLSSYKVLQRYISDNNVTLPVVIMSDGHSSRYNYEVLKFLCDSIMKMYLGPPDTTSCTQTLDQINRNLHYHYNNTRDDMFTGFNTINRESFMLILADIWDKWASPESIRKAAKRVGISSTGLNVNWMQQEKFKCAAACIDKSLPVQSTCSTLSSSSLSSHSSSLLSHSASSLSHSSAPLLTSFPPQSVSATSSRKREYPNIVSPEKATKTRRYSIPWYKEQLRSADTQIGQLKHEKSICLEEIPGLLSIKKVRPNELKRKNVKVTNVHGSVEGNNILEIVKRIQEEKDLKAQKKQQQQNEKLKEQEAFNKCVSQCVCGQKVCCASKLKKCGSCGSVLRSVCGKAACRVDGKKPTMILPAKHSIKTRTDSVLSTKTRQHNEDSEADESDSDLSTQDNRDSDSESSDSHLSIKTVQDIKELESDGEQNTEIIHTYINLAPLPQPDLVPLKYADVILESWVIVFYEEEKFLGMVLDKRNGKFLIQCLNSPYGFRRAQQFERDAIWYDSVYKSPVIPFETDVDDDGNTTRKTFYKY